MDNELINPNDELAQIDKAIIKYQILLKSAKDHVQREIYEKRINELKASRNEIRDLHNVNKKSKINYVENVNNKSFITEIMATERKQEYANDSEVNILFHYLNFFYQEFLSVFSERKMRLDFKFSLERDKFHHLYQELTRHLKDYQDEVYRLKQGKFSREMQLELKHRNMQKKRNILIETDRFFKRLEKFLYEILNDLNGDELICLNGDDIINFDFIEEKRYLEGFTVRDGMHKLYNFVIEVIGFLNIPDID